MARAGPRTGEPEPAPVPRCTLAMLSAATRRTPDHVDPGEERYSCQATELLRAAPERIPSWDGRQYVRDVRSGNAGALAMIRTVAVGLFNEYQDASRRLLPAPLRMRSGRRYPFIEGRLEQDPSAGARPAARGAGTGQEQGGDRRDARRQQRQPRHVLRRRDGALLRPGVPGAAAGRADHRRDRPARCCGSRIRASSWRT